MGILAAPLTYIPFVRDIVVAFEGPGLAAVFISNALIWGYVVVSLFSFVRYRLMRQRSEPATRGSAVNTPRLKSLVSRKQATVSENVFRNPKETKSHRCPCCGYLTLSDRGRFEICEVCYWEDDSQDDQDANTVRGGPNGDLSLTQARRNYSLFGASDRAFCDSVREPAEDEK
jgi:hypothetical protein